MQRLTRVVHRWLNEDYGQDIIEYALLCAFIAFAGMTILSAMGGTMRVAYLSWTDPMKQVGPGTLPETPDPLP